MGKIIKIIIIVTALLLNNCSEPIMAIFDINLLVNANDEKVNDILGKPEKSEKFTKQPCGKDNCFLNVYLNNQLEIIFLNDKVGRITFTPKNKIKFKENSIEYLGLKPLKPTTETKTVLRWDNFYNLQEVAVFKLNNEYIDYYLIRVTF
ncbi:hypothetical protein ND860_18435 [Leptospira levettii]|uniref:Lipoprotein n=1 Tax=Leptospira levettii TaxID=2023178 RepID=A0AAW5V844_9LEPT|nr:hypothetical protein [Leptospira levettii]MCW7467840.1 hypothetical protein [Leptospira levettii]MCW7498520.1 hypothetical protein [Leptospira levettii]MCW7513471.1 hypothetical protein [Leptospira levettii]MCW7517267.1 hypothetical protein [Leptospira levettii]